MTLSSVPKITSAPAAADRPLYEKMALKAKDLFLQVCDESTWMRELSFALQIITGNNLLQNVARTPAGAQSITNAIVNIALTGTTLNPVLKKAYLVPRSVNGTMLCCLDFSYQGLVGIAVDSGSVKYINAVPVYSFDAEFTYEILDGDIKIKHRPSLDPPEGFLSSPDKFWEYIVCCYTVATLHDGSKMVFPPLPKWKLKKAMDTSKTTSANTPWRTHPDEMSLKTALKHDYKLLPQTDRMSKAVSVLNEHEGIETEADRRAQARSAADAMFTGAEEASYTNLDNGQANKAPEGQQQGPQSVDAGTRQAQPKKETTVDPVISPSQVEEIERLLTATSADYGQFLDFMNVTSLTDITVSTYGTAISALESKRRQQESATARQNQSSSNQGGLFQQATSNEIITALTAKNISAQIDEATGTVFAKLSYGDKANQEFLKGLGFKWDATNKSWYWLAA